jgi:Cu/Ag efflux protein CusF
MKALQRLLAAAVLALGTIATPVFAQATDLTSAEVRKVDAANRKITLKHEAIKSLDMPPMTMIYHVTDAVALDKVKAGDQVRFKATHDDGKYTVTELQPAK